MTTDAPKVIQKQAPPGAVPTKSEVDQLINKMAQLKINKASLEMEPWSFSWTPREAELMNNQAISVEVKKKADEQALQLQEYLSRSNTFQNGNRGQQMMTQGRPPTPYQNQMQDPKGDHIPQLYRNNS